MVGTPRLRAIADALLAPLGLRLTRARSAPPTLPSRHRCTAGGRTLEFWLRDDEVRTWYERDAWDDVLEVQVLRAACRPGDRVLDVGCNLGFMTAIAQGAVGPGGHVLAIDADPWNAILAAANCHHNGLANVTVRHAAVGRDHHGHVRIAIGMNASVRTAAADDALGEPLPMLEVPLVSVEGLAREHGTFDVLKVDVEGFEGDVLRGIGDALRPGARLHLEWHGSMIERYEPTATAWAALRPERWRGHWFPHDDQHLRPFDPAMPPPGTPCTFALTRRD